MLNQKHNVVATLAGILLMGLFAAPVMADEETSQRAKWQERMQQFDQDGDGQLNDEERQALRAAHKAKVLENHDADGDGELNEAERQAFREARRAKLIDRFDADGDGELNERERQNARETWNKFRDKRQQFRERQGNVAGSS